MRSDSKILDDIARVAGGAVNILSGLKQQTRGEVRSRVEGFAAGLDLVTRAEFEALADRIAALEEARRAPRAKTKRGRKAASARGQRAHKKPKRGKTSR